MRRNPTIITLAAALAATSALTVVPAPGMPVPAAIVRQDFPSRAEIRNALDLSRPLADYLITPAETNPLPDPDCATQGRPEATSAVVYPAERRRVQAFEYHPRGSDWQLVGRVMVLEYASPAQARAAHDRVQASVRGARGYGLVCEAINPIVSGQRVTPNVDVPGRTFTWRYRLRAGNAGSFRDVVTTRGPRLVWIELGRVASADLDWSDGTPSAVFPRYPSRAYLRRLASVAATRGL